MSLCTLCPRECKVDRATSARGYCGEGDRIRVARIAPHFYEEPIISGKRGSGTIFFSGCSLGCVFCQNSAISRRGGIGKEMEERELQEAILALAQTGVHNINLVTPTHFLHRLIPLLTRLRAKGELRIPVVYNSSGYESVEVLKRLEGLVDIYLPDFKYFSPELARKYSGAADYPAVALDAISEMYRQVGRYNYSQSDTGMLASGLVVRHLILPACRHDSIAILHRLASLIPVQDILVSVMSQYTPDFALSSPHKELHRRITAFEYESVKQVAAELGFDGFFQSRTSASDIFTPSFEN